MSLILSNRFLLKFVDISSQVFCSQILIKLPIQMAKNISQSAAVGKQNRFKIKGKSKFAPGIVKFQVLGSGANGAPRCLYLFTDHSR